VSASVGDTTDGGQPLLRQLLLAGVGWASEGMEAADAVADDLARRVGVERDEMRAAVRDTLASWRRELERVGARGDEASERALARLGLARRETLDDLALRVAQLEHRLSLLERESDGLQLLDRETDAPPDEKAAKSDIFARDAVDRGPAET
jgi:polyhydroxyalkanoate synthesis regulator phasin